MFTRFKHFFGFMALGTLSMMMPGPASAQPKASLDIADFGSFHVGGRLVDVQGKLSEPTYIQNVYNATFSRRPQPVVEATYLEIVDESKLAGPLTFTTASVPGMAIDSIFYWTGKGVNWDVYGHGFAGDTSVCIPDANGYYTSNAAAPNFYEWCGDHNKALEKNPLGQVASGIRAAPAAA